MSCSVTERVTSRAGAGAPSGANSKCRGPNLATLATSPNHRGEGPGPRPPQNGPHSSPVQEVPRDYSFRSKPCCTLLWCCCCKCPCSNTGNKGSEENGGATKNSISELDSEVFTQPTLEEIRSWGKNFDKLMKNPDAMALHAIRCKPDSFFRAVTCTVFTNQAMEPYVSLDSRVREIVNRNMVEPTPNTFDEAQLQIYLLMNRDSYPRFVNSQMYKSLAQLDKIDREKQTSSASSVASGDLNASIAQVQSTSGASASAATPLLAATEVQKEQVVPSSATVRDQQDVK